MTRIYTSYGLTLFSAFAVFWMFGLMSSVSAGSTWIPFSAFIASIIHFGLSSWLFLTLPKAGKVIAISSATIMCVWPIAAIWGTASQGDLFGIVIYSIPIIFSAIVIGNHIKTFKQNKKPTLLTRIILSIIPFVIFIAYSIYIWTLIISRQITIG